MRYSRVIASATLMSAFLGAASLASAACSGTYCSSDSHSVSYSHSDSYLSSPLDSQFTLAPTGYSAGSASDVPAGMCPIACDTSQVNVNAPAGSRVLACYAPCAAPEPVIAAPQISYVPQAVTTAYRVVRPVIAVPYPVRVMVPNSCGPIQDAPSRYGSSYGYTTCGR